MNNRLEKKFIYNIGDESYKYFLISGMFKETYPKRVVNSIYFDTDIYQDVWDNINGFGNRKKIRIRWYNELNNSPVFIEEKKKIGFVTQKKIENLGNFKNFSDLTLFIKNEYYQKSSLFKNKKINIKKALILQYERNYFELYNKKLRVTVDKKLKIFQKFPNKFIENDKLIIELKYSVKNSSYVNNFVKNNFLDNRNQKYSKYVNSFIDMNENALI
tara:strand:- start:999 stop:1646 length:648 start_codon:yes stop_codon:yes gene_type:complete